MNSFVVALGVAALVFASGGAGLFLQSRLPEHHTADRSRDMIGGVVGLVGLLLALVLGLLIWTAYGVFTTQQTELQTLSAKALEFDLEMRQYGSEASHAREILRTDLVWAHEQFWGEENASDLAYAGSYANMDSMSAFLGSLEPKTDTQKLLLGDARRNYGFIGEYRLLMSLQLTHPIAWPLIIAVTTWSCLQFLGLGVLSRPNAATLVALALGTCAVASAIFLILELSQPYTSSIRISPSGLEEVIVQLDK
jgi:hypothetical protein